MSKDFQWAVNFAKGRIGKMRHLTDEFQFSLSEKQQLVLDRLAQEYASAHLVEYEINKATQDAKSFEVLKHTAAYLIEQRAVMPESLKHWTAGVLRGDIKRPKGKAGNVTAAGSHYAIYRLVSIITAHTSLKPTRNEESPPHSACDAVAEAMKQMRLKTNTYSGVRAAYDAGRKVAMQ